MGDLRGRAGEAAPERFARMKAAALAEGSGIL
jgi:hypothetical protein